MQQTVKPVALRVSWHVHDVSVCEVLHIQIVESLLHPHVVTDTVGPLLRVVCYIVELTLLLAVDYHGCPQKASQHRPQGYGIGDLDSLCLGQIKLIAKVWEAGFYSSE